MRIPRARDSAILAYALLNAVLYSAMLPLWEGFDEAFHYAYIQHVSTIGALPVLGEASLSREVQQSLQIVPVSQVVAHDFPGLITFDRYFALPQAERERLRETLLRSPRQFQTEQGPMRNYEAHQAPLSYVLLVIPDRMLAGVALPNRVLWLRMFAAIAGTLLMFTAAHLLAKELCLEGHFRGLLLFCVFSSQMYWATTAHIANDWLAVPLAVCLLVCGIRFARAPDRRTAIHLAAALSLGLLTKAYFLVWVPGALFLTLWHARKIRLRGFLWFIGIVAAVGAPWYVRNLVLYHSLTGTVESVNGVGVVQVLDHFFAVPWASSIRYMARASLWTANNSFSTFSLATLNVVLALLAAGCGLYAISLRRSVTQSAETIVVLFSAALCAGLAYITVSSFYFRQGASAGASPWYMQPLLAPVLVLAFLGLQRSGKLGRVLGMLTAVLWGYVLGATYVVKLIPLYAGFQPARSTLAGVCRWYFQVLADGSAFQSPAFVGAAGFVYVLTGCGVLLGGAVAISLVRD